MVRDESGRPNLNLTFGFIHRLRVDTLAATIYHSILGSPRPSEMSLFEGRIGRSVLYAGGAAVVAHLVMMLVPSSVQTYSLMQTAVAILAIASFSIMVVTHHRRRGDLLTQAQEEMVLVAAFGLFWFAVLLGWRAFQQRSFNPGEVAGTDLASATGRSANKYNEGFTPGRRPYPCSSDSTYCVVEEWTYW